jgi:predicted nucleic acid-binding protein
MSQVLDASMTLAWVYLDETTEAVVQVFEALREDGAWVPALWRLEVANILQMNVNRRRHRATFRDAALAELALLPIHLDGETDRHAWGETLRLAERLFTMRLISSSRCAGKLRRLRWTGSCVRLPRVMELNCSGCEQLNFLYFAR